MQDRKVNTELSRVLSGPALQSNTSAGIQDAVAVAVASGAPAADVASANGGGASALADAIAQNTASLSQVHSTLQGQLDSIVANTQAVIDNTSSQSGTSAVADVAGGVANSILGGGLLGTLFSGLTHLFGGGNSEAPAPLVKFALPPAVNYEGGVQGANATGIDHGQNGQPRPVTTGSSSPQVTVNVSAMDSRSFLDHSSDIANAVRRAMLESSSLNDVIGEM